MPKRSVLVQKAERGKAIFDVILSEARPVRFLVRDYAPTRSASFSLL